MRIVKLTREIVENNIDELTSLDKSIGVEERWGIENFMRDLEGKWENSFIAMDEDNIIAFIICSLKDKYNLHIHRFVVKKECRHLGIGSHLIKFAISNLNSSVKFVTLKVRKDKISVQDFYKKNEFKLLNSE